MAKKNSLKYGDVVALGEVLKKHCSQGPNKTAVYAEGWDDERVVKEMEGRASLSNVVGLRRALFGDLRKAVKPGSLPDLLARLEALEAWAAARPVQGFKREDA